MILSPPAIILSNRVDLTLATEVSMMTDTSLRRRQRRRRSSATAEVEDTGNKNNNSLLKKRSSSEKSLFSLMKLHSRGDNTTFPSPGLAGMMKKERDDQRSSRTHSTRRSYMNKSFSLRETNRSTMGNQSFSLREANKRTTGIGANTPAAISTSRAAASAHSRRGDFSSRRRSRTGPSTLMLQQEEAVAAVATIPETTFAVADEYSVRRGNSRTDATLLPTQQEEAADKVSAMPAAPIAAAAIAAAAPEPSTRRRNSRTGASILMLQQENSVLTAVTSTDPLATKKSKPILKKQASESRRMRRTAGRTSTRKQHLQASKMDQLQEREAGSRSPQTKDRGTKNASKRMSSKSAPTHEGPSLRRLSSAKPSSVKDPQQISSLRRVASTPSSDTACTSSEKKGDARASKRRAGRKSAGSTDISKHSNDNPSLMSGSSSRRHSGHSQKSPVSVVNPISSVDNHDDDGDDGVEFHEDSSSKQQKQRNSHNATTMKKSSSEVDAFKAAVTIAKAAVTTANLSRSQSLSAIKAKTVPREDKPWEQKTIRQQIAEVQIQSKAKTSTPSKGRSRSQSRRPKTPSSKGKSVVKIDTSSNHKGSPSSKGKKVVNVESKRSENTSTDATETNKIDEGEQIVQAAATMAQLLDTLLKGVNTTTPASSTTSDKEQELQPETSSKVTVYTKEQQHDKTLPPVTITTPLRSSTRTSSRQRSASLSLRNTPKKTSAGTTSNTFHQGRSSLQSDEMAAFTAVSLKPQSEDLAPVAPSRGRSRAMAPAKKNRGRARSLSISAPSSVRPQCHQHAADTPSLECSACEIVLPSVVGASRWASEQ